MENKIKRISAKNKFFPYRLVNVKLVKSAKTCCTDQKCSHNFGFDVCEKCKQKNRRQTPLQLHCTHCKAPLRNFI